MSGEAQARAEPPKLRWRKPDDYHIRSECSRFTVTRLTVNDFVWYIAFRRATVNGELIKASEIGATRLPKTASEEERKCAIREMQQLCEGEA